MSRSKSETAIFSIFLQFFDRIRAVKIGLWDDTMKVDLIRLKNRSKLRFRHTFREKFGVLGLKMVEIGQKSLFLVISDCSLAVSDRKSHKISFSLAKMDSRAHFKIEIRVLRFVSENRFLVIWGLFTGNRYRHNKFSRFAIYQHYHTPTNTTTTHTQETAWPEVCCIKPATDTWRLVPRLEPPRRPPGIAEAPQSRRATRSAMREYRGERLSCRLSTSCICRARKPTTILLVQ